MTKSPTVIRAFCGFQLHSEFHDVDDLISLMTRLKRVILKEKNIMLEIRYGKFPPGSVLWDEVTHSIEWAHVAIFDISENNPNVMIEVGLALGLERQVIMLKNRRSLIRYPTPSDVSRSIYVPYENKDLRTSVTLKELVDGLDAYLRRSSKSEHAFKNVWGFDENDTVTIICSELDKPEVRMYPEPNEFIYLSKYGDLDSLVAVLTTLHRLYRKLKVEYLTGKEAKQRRTPYTGNIVLIGGSDYNAATRVFMKHSPYEYKRGPKGENDIYLRNKNNGNLFHPEFRRSGGHQRIRDYGFFVKIRNPMNQEKKVIMIGGPHTYGVYGAARAFGFEGETIQSQNCKLIAEKLGANPEFSAIFDVSGVDQSIGIPCLEAKNLTGKVNL